MERKYIFYFVLPLLLAGCGNNEAVSGKKVAITDKSTVYYKGAGVTDSLALRLGNFLKEVGYFNGKDEQAVQLTAGKDSGFQVHFIIDKVAYQKNSKQYRQIFWYWQDLLSEQVFKHKPVSVVLSDRLFKEVEAMEPLHKVTASPDHQLFFHDDISSQLAGKTAAALDSSGFFTFTGSDAILTSENRIPVLRFIRNAGMIQTDSVGYYQTLTNFQYLLSKVDVLKSVKLILLDESFSDAKTFRELSPEEKQSIDQSLYRTKPEIKKPH
jgi:hypothetical protein